MADRPSASESQIPARRLTVLVYAMAAAAASGMVYELAIATVSGYVLGDNITHFSIVVGIFLCAMGIGAALSRKVLSGLLSTFLVIEIWLGLFGILACPALLYIGFVLDFTAIYFLAMIIITGSIGVFVGLEIPIISRYLETFSGTRKALANVLAADYIGSLVGALAFPILLLPKLGLIGSSALAGMFNVLVATAVVVLFRRQLRHASRYLACCALLMAGLVATVAVRQPLFERVEDRGYRDPVVHREQSAYQRIVITRAQTPPSGPGTAPAQAGYLPRRWKDDLRLFLDGHLQFSSLDEYRYHEALVHPAMTEHRAPRRILILGGGDGLAAAEIFKYPQVRSVTLVDLDPRMVRLGRENAALRRLNRNALHDARMRIEIADAFAWIRRTGQRFDVVVADFPDPHTPVLSRLYSREFFTWVKSCMRPGGVFVTQSSSPYFARRAFWTVRRTLEAAGFQAASYHVDVPAFGDWGFHLASAGSMDPGSWRLRVATRFLSDDLMAALFLFGKDIGPLPVAVNTLTNMKLYAAYQDGDWQEY